MKRKMIGAAAAYMSGLFFASFFTGGSDLLLIAGLLPIFFIITSAIKLPRCDSILIAVSFCTAYCVSTCYSQTVYENIVAYNGKTGNFTGTIENVEFYDENKASYILDGKINAETTAKITFYGDAHDVEVGDRLSLKQCTFEIPQNDFLFDAESYYKSDNIFLSAENPESMSFEHIYSHKLKRVINSYRERIISDFTIKLGETKGGFLSGIVFGATDNIDNVDKTLLYRCGIGHIMAVSGLHVSIIMALLMLILQKLRVNKYVSFITMNLFLLLMIILVRSPISAIRAVIMLDIMYSARLFLRQNNSFNSLAIAVLLICISNPYVIFDSGFLLSVSGTFGIAVFGPYMTKDMKDDTVFQRFIKNTALMLCVMLSIMPFSILYFEETSIISPITNLLIIPFCVCAMVIGVIYVISGGLISFLSIAGLMIDIVMAVTDYIGRIDFLHFSSGNITMFMISVVCSAVVIIMYGFFRSRRLTALLLVGAVTVYFFSSATNTAIQKNKIKVVVLGRGSNAAVIITHKKGTDIVDLSGHHRSPDYVRKYLALNGIAEVNSLVLTTDVNSQYASYTKSLSLVDVHTILIAGNYDFPEYGISETIITEDRIITVHNDLYDINFDNDLLTISVGDLNLSFIPTNSDIDKNDDLIIRYGNITKKSKIFDDNRNIYLDTIGESDFNNSGYNNFEIEISDQKSEFILRRL